MSGDCWMWKASKNNWQYGWFMLDGRPHLAHRVAWRLTFGEIPEGKLVCHHCDNPPCVRPSHLFIGTDAINAADRNAKGRTRGAAGSLNKHAKLSEDDVRAIRKASGTQAAIGLQFGISQQMVSRIKSGKLWRHVITAEEVAAKVE